MYQWRFQDFPQGGSANSQNCYYFSNFCRKLHENERIRTPREGASLPPPLDPPMCTALLFNIFLFLLGYSETTFLATITLGTTPANPLVFDVAVINTGGFYNAATGIYTVPVDGVYEFTVHLFTTAESDDAGSAFLVVDNTRVSHSQLL